MSYRHILGSILLVLGTQLLSAQSTGEDKLGIWAMYFGTNQVADKWSIHTEVQYRDYELFSNFNQLLLRTGANYHISEKAVVTLGYGYIETDPSFSDPDAESNSSENRIFQQFILRNNVGKFKFTHRYRLEQRFLNPRGVESRTEHRARYFLRVTYPLSEKWFLTAYDEIFINLQEPLFGQNRLYGALGYQVNPNVALQAGYLKNHFTGANFDRLQLAIFWKTDLRKKDTKKDDS
jgi:long-subunit fatty acid transport protein